MILEQIIKDNNMTQQMLGDKLGVSQSLISQWVNGLCQPQITMLPKLAKELNCTIDEIVKCFEKREEK